METRQIPKDSIVEGRKGRYRVAQELSRGGLGVVYAARNIATGEKVAVKVLHNDRFILTDAIYLRFIREIQYGNALTHPHLVRVLDAGTENDFLVMEYVDGIPLQRAYATLTFQHKRQLAAQILAGIEYIHTAGFLHRDIKPNNILLTHDHIAKICDYGLLKKISDEEPYITNTLDNLGSLLYVSENQRDRPSNVGPIDDIYSAAIVLYELFSSERMSVRWKPKKMIHAGTKLRQRVVSIIHESHQLSVGELIADLRDCVSDHSSEIPVLFDGLRDLFGTSVINCGENYVWNNALGHDLVTFLQKSGIFNLEFKFHFGGSEGLGGKRTLKHIVGPSGLFDGRQLQASREWKKLSTHYKAHFQYVLNAEIEEHLKKAM